MPIYEYQCERCGTFDVLQGSSDKPLKYCPTCEKQKKKTKVQRMVSSPSFHLKGSGWYKTDYASKPASSESKAESSSKETKSND